MSARRTRRDPMEELRDAGDELWEVWKLVHRCKDATRDVSSSAQGSAFNHHAYLSAYLEATHAHMVGRDTAERAIRRAYAGPRPAAGDRARGQELFGRLLSDYCWHRSALEDDVRFVAGWIKQFDVQPSRRSEPEQEAER